MAKHRIKIKIARRSLVAAESAYTNALALRTIDGSDPFGLLLFECAVELRDRISEMLERKERKNYSLELSRSEAAALHYFWIGQPIHSHDAGQAINALIGAIDQWRKSPQRLIAEIL